MLYSCDKCGAKIDLSTAFKLLNSRYCSSCITPARKERRQRVNAEREKRKRYKGGNALTKRISQAESHPIYDFVSRIREQGVAALNLDNLPFRLKRNEKAYFIAGASGTYAFEISLALTNTRLFYSDRATLHKSFSRRKNELVHFRVVNGIKSIPLASIIALDEPSPNSNYRIWEIGFHLSNGTRIGMNFEDCLTSRYFYALTGELVDRLNDPIEESAFIPTRERIPDDVKIAVWRRDGGACVRCGSRNNLEYDHIIPISKGGSNSLRNVELLCQTCNRTKSDKIL